MQTTLKVMTEEDAVRCFAQICSKYEIGQIRDLITSAKSLFSFNDISDRLAEIKSISQSEVREELEGACNDDAASQAAKKIDAMAKTPEGRIFLNNLLYRSFIGNL